MACSGSFNGQTNRFFVEQRPNSSHNSIQSVGEAGRGGPKGDQLTEGNGPDVFGLGSGNDTIKDFGRGDDRIEISGHTGGFDALTIVDTGTSTTITHDGGTIMLWHATGLGLTASDFDFA